MSISKSRWKGALLATVAASVLSPLAAKAQTPGSMTLDLSLNPMGSVVAGSAFGTTEYIAPDSTVPIYVYATVTQAGPIASNNVAGIQYAYFNILQNSVANDNPVNIGGINASDGSITSVTLNSALHMNNNGSQPGATNFSSGTLAVGTSVVNATTMTALAKPRSGSPVWSNSLPSDGTNVYISGNTVSFLLETLTYTPSWLGNPKQWTDPNLGQNNLTISIPTLPVNYAGANYFTGAPNGSTGSPGNGSVGTTYTHSVYSAANTTIGAYTFQPTVRLYDAAIGDARLEGTVNLADITRVGIGYNNGLSGWSNGDFFNAGFTELQDITATGIAYNNGAAYGPFALGTGPSAQIGTSAVPEPASLGLLTIAAVGLASRRRGRKSI